MAVRYKFVNLTINGKSMGVYAMEEHFSKELAESQKRRDGVMISFDEYRYWKNLDAPLTSAQLASSYQSAEINIRNNKRTQESPLLLKQKVTAINLLRGFQEKSYMVMKFFHLINLGVSLRFVDCGMQSMLFYYTILIFTTIRSLAD